MKIAVIQARGGSKRIPRKNIRFYGKPMIAWSIEIDKASGLFDRILVTTKYLEIILGLTDVKRGTPLDWSLLK